MRKYETIFILQPDLGEDDIKNICAKVQEVSRRTWRVLQAGRLGCQEAGLPHQEVCQGLLLFAL